MRRGGTDVRARVEADISFSELLNALEHFAEKHDIARVSSNDVQRVYEASMLLLERLHSYTAGNTINLKVISKDCTIPPPGWSCTRIAGHLGPCAAVENSRHHGEYCRE